MPARFPQAMTVGFLTMAAGVIAWIMLCATQQRDFDMGALLIAVCIGHAVRLGAKRETGLAFGVAAGTLTTLGIVSALVGIGYLRFEHSLRATEADGMVVLATEIADAWSLEGRELDWPPGESSDTAMSPEAFPVSVWQEAESRWGRLSVLEREELVQAHEQGVRSLASRMSTPEKCLVILGDVWERLGLLSLGIMVSAIVLATCRGTGLLGGAGRRETGVSASPEA